MNIFLKFYLAVMERPGLGAAVGACVGFIATQGATYVNYQWDDASRFQETEYRDWLSKYSPLPIVRTSAEAAEQSERYNDSLKIYRSDVVRIGAIQVSTYYDQKKRTFEKIEHDSQKAEADKKEAERRAQLAKEAADDAAAKSAAEANRIADVLLKNAQDAKQESIRNQIERLLPPVL